MTGMVDVSIIISFYNKIDYLKLILPGLKDRHLKSFEIIIADDGSGQKVINEIEQSFQEKFHIN